MGERRERQSQPMTESEQLAHVRRVCKMVSEDATADAAELDGKPFTGLSTGDQFGKVLASVKALAQCVDTIAGQLE